MRFSCSTRDLQNALSIATRVMAAHSPMSVLEGILLDVDAEDNSITVASSDGNMTSLTKIPADVEIDGMAVMPGRFFTDIIRKLPEGRVSADLNANFVLKLSCGFSRFNIAAKRADDFPVPQEVEAEQVVELPEPMLKDMINTIAFSIPQEDTRRILTGGCLNLSNGVLDLVGLDGFRMGMRTARLSDVEQKAKAIIPVRALEEISRLMGEDESKMARLTFGKNRLLTEAGQSRLFSSLIEGEYIEYRRIIPAAFGVSARVGSAEFSQGVERASLIARQSRHNLLCFEIGEGKLIMTATSDAGDVREELEAVTQGELKIVFNVRYMTEISRVLSGERILLSFNTAVTPCVITPEEGDGFTYLVLPVRTNA